MKSLLLVFAILAGQIALGQDIKFDPKRIAAADLQAAMVEAQRTGKYILLDVGGDWCQYCHEMNELFRQHPELTKLRDDKFVVVSVYYASDNKNKEFLSHYDKVEGIPHFYVLDSRGKQLHSQHVRYLREGGAYSPEKMKAFLLQFSTDLPRTN
jgi:thioredoxin-related protein